MNIERSEQEIWDLLNQCSEAENEGVSKYPGMSYEQGVILPVAWCLASDAYRLIGFDKEDKGTLFKMAQKEAWPWYEKDGKLKKSETPINHENFEAYEQTK